MLAAAFGTYFVVVAVAAYAFSDSIAVYVDPGATTWILSAYVLLGAAGLIAICAGAVSRAGKLDDRLDVLEAERRRVREIEQATREARLAAPPPPEAAIVDSGSPENEVAALLDDLAKGASLPPPEDTADAAVKAGRAPSAVEELLKADAWKVERVRVARDALAGVLLGPALAAIGIVGIFAPLLPAADGMLVANLQLNAFLGVAGAGGLIGFAAYAFAAFRQIRP